MESDAISDHPHRAIAEALIAATSKGNADAVAALFTPDAVIDDPSTGHRFDDHPGIRDYVERYFVNYHTVTRLLSIDTPADGRIRIRVDFSGDFGHEIGLLDLMAMPTDASRASTRTSNREASCPS